MSKIALSPNASGSGTVTITAPNTNTNRTIALPDVAGTVVTTSDILSAMPVGSIIQVKSTVVSGNLGTGTQDLVSVSITPTDNTNKILVMGSGLCYCPQGTSTAADVYRDSAFIFRTAAGVGWGASGSNNNESFTPVYLDNPQTTNAITYKMQGLHVSGTTAPSWGYYTSSATGNTSITVMEVVV